MLKLMFGFNLITLGNGFAKRPGSEICMNRDQEYVPLKTLLAQTEMTDDVNGESTKENWV